MTSRPLRVAFPPVGGNHWMGGQNYLKNLIKLLLSNERDTVHPVIIADHDYAPDMIAELENDGANIIRDDRFAQYRQGRRLARALLTGTDNMAATVYRDAGIDLVFESANYHGWRFPIPTLAWFPDFQHRHMPQMFGKAAWGRRELGFRAALARGEHVLLSSNDAACDLRRFYPSSKATVHVVPFAVPRPAVLNSQQIDRFRSSAGLPQRWLFLPNQFWRHKNHTLLVEALAIARKACPDIAVVCTGSTNDPRHPDYYVNLMKRVVELELERHFIPLGMVPYEQVSALFQGAVALINPSLFEGWSTVVEEAKAMGKPMILSDLAVHKEQSNDRSRFFVRDDPVDCARAMVEQWNATTQLPVEIGVQKSLAHFSSKFAHAVQTAAKTGG
jgi:glycosyltransferase involved in cell wall biosynthesis